MNLHIQRVKIAENLFQMKDFSPAFRKMIDVAQDTENIDIFNETLQLTERAENETQDKESLTQDCLSFLDKIKNYPLIIDTSTEPILIGTGIFKRYLGGNFSLGPLDVSIQKRKITGLVGENGNGKTTLLRILAKDISYDKGSLQFLFSQKMEDEYGIRSKLVYIPQRTPRWYGSLRSNLKFAVAEHGFPPEENEARMLMMVARFGLWKYKDLRWDQLSSGYKMRFELARTMLRRPEILLLDEPLGNLDILAQQNILEDLKSISESATHPIAIILSSQQLYEVEKVSDSVIFLKDGKSPDNAEHKANAEKCGLIIEIEVQNSREELMKAFEDIGLEKLTYTGGLYIAQFLSDTKLNYILMALAKAEIKVVYIRNISQSTRRFFVN